MELGTKIFPYKTFKPVSYEILRLFSHSRYNLTILIKDGTKVYIEDDTNFFMSMGSVTISTYSWYPSNSGKALIVPTTIPQTDISGRNAFHVLKNIDLPIEEIISMGNYDESVLQKIKRTGTTFQIVQTNFSIKNVDIYREEIDYNEDSLFMN
jgi:hypothetical protein